MYTYLALGLLYMVPIALAVDTFFGSHSLSIIRCADFSCFFYIPMWLPAMIFAFTLAATYEDYKGTTSFKVFNFIFVVISLVTIYFLVPLTFTFARHWWGLGL